MIEIEIISYEKEDLHFLERLAIDLKTNSEVLFKFDNNFYYVQETDEGFDINVWQNEEDIFNEDNILFFDYILDGGVFDGEEPIDAIMYAISFLE